MEYDEDGRSALSGKPDKTLLAKLDALDYYKMKEPKSLGFEWLQTYFMPCLKDSVISVHDKLATVTEHVAGQIKSTLNSLEGNSVLVTGGGAKNRYLIQRISDGCNKNVIIPDDRLVDYKEALVFAFLGLLRVLGEVNCLASVTGARRDSCGGILYEV